MEIENQSLHNSTQIVNSHNMYICIYLHTHIYTHTYTYTYSYTHIHIYPRIHTYTESLYRLRWAVETFVCE